MENRTEFNLNRSIEIWKSKLFENSNMTLDNINELESHLHDEIHELQNLGLSNEESLLIAKNRIGNIDELTTEFSKVNKEVYFRNKIIPYLKGALLFIAFITITESLTHFSLLIASQFGINNTNLISIGFLILSTLFFLLLFYKKYKQGSYKIRRLTNIPILASTIIVSKLLSYLSLVILTRTLWVSDFGVIQMNLTIYKVLFVLLVLICSCLVFYSIRKENKIKIVE